MAAVLTALLFAAGCRCQETAPSDTAPPAEAAPRPWSESKDKVTCPVCGLTFPREEATGEVTYKDKKYYFYLDDHKKAFEASPEQYATTPSPPKSL